MTTSNTQDNTPGTEYLVDTNHSLDVSHAGSGSSDIVLLPQPTACGRDPLVKYFDLIYYRSLADDETALVDAQEVLAVDAPRFVRVWLLVWREQPWCCTYRYQPRGECTIDCSGGRRCVELSAFGECIDPMPL